MEIDLCYFASRRKRTHGGAIRAMAQSKFSVEGTQHQEEITVNWTIPKFKEVYTTAKANKQSIIAKEEFVIGGKNWAFHLQQYNEEDVGIFLNILGPDCASADYTVFVKNIRGKLIKDLYKEHRKYAPKEANIPGAADNWGCKKWKSVSQFQLEGCLPNGELELKLKVIVYHTPTEVNLKRDLSKDLKNALDSGVGDVTFMFTGEGTRKVIAQIPAHRTILCVRSPVFKTMFASGMKEASEGKVKISDLTPNAMRILLRFMYTGEVAPEWRDLVDELIYGADKYQLDQLKAFLCENITSALTSVNAMKIRNLGALYNLPEVVEAAMKFMKENFEQFFELHDIVLKGASTSTR